MSNPSSPLNRRGHLLTNLLLIAGVILLGGIALHYQAEVYLSLRQIGDDPGPAPIAMLDWPVWSHPAIDLIVWATLTALVILIVLCVRRSWLTPVKTVGAIALVLIAAVAQLAYPNLVQAQVNASDQAVLQAAITAYRHGDYAAAAGKFEQLHHSAKGETKRMEAVGWLSGVHYFQNDYVASVAAACDYARQATPLQRNWKPNITTLHWAIYRLAQSSANLDEAIQRLDSIATCQGVSEASHLWLAISPGLNAATSDVYYLDDTYVSDAARAALLTLVERYPNDTSADLALLALGKYDQLIQQYPASPLLERAYYSRAVHADEQHDLDQARVAFQAYIDQFPHRSHTEIAIRRVGHILEEQGDLSGALSYFLQAAYPAGPAGKIEPDSFIEAYRSDVLYLLDVEMRADDIQHFIAQHPDLPGQDLLRFSQAADLLAEDRYAEARVIFQELAQTTLVEANLQKASQNNLAKIATIQAALNSLAPDAALDLALFYLQKQPVFYNELWAYQRRRTTDDRGAPWSYYQQRNDQLRAVALLQRYLDQHPNESRAAEALFNLGQAYSTLGSVDGFLPFDAPSGYDVRTLRQKAVAIFNTLLQEYPNSQYFDQALAETGLVYIEREPIESEPAIQQFRALVQNYPEHHLANNALNWVAYLECLSAYFEEPGTASWQQKYEQARTDYQLILDKYPQGHVGRTAQQNLRIIQSIRDQPDRWPRSSCVYNVP